jgi:hypothetical protein
MLIVGDYDTVEGINEASTLPKEVLQEYPAITTWNKLLSGEGVSH